MTAATIPTLSTQQPGSTYRWLVVVMLWFVCFLNYADRQGIFSVFPLIKQELHLSDVQLGVVGASFMWMYALFGPFAGWLCDRLPRKTVVLGALIFWSITTAASALTRDFGQLVVCRTLGGLGEAFYFPAAMSIIGDYHSSYTRSRAMSLHQSAVYAGTVAGGVVSAAVGQFYGWRDSFTLFGGAGILLGAILWGLLKEPSRGMSEPAPSAIRPNAFPLTNVATDVNIIAGFREVLANRMVLILAAVFVGANFVAVVFLVWMPTFLYQKFHMSIAMAGLNGTAYLQIASVVGVFSGGLLADAFVRKRPGGRLLTQSLGLLGGVPFLFLTGWSTSVPWLIFAMVGFGYFKGIYDANIWASLYDVVRVSRRGVAGGIVNSLGWLGGGFAPIVIAVAAQRYGMSACISATAGIYMFIGLLLLLNAKGVERR